jgi:hypothetical protein
MEGNSSHGYLPEDVGYDDLLDSSGWPAATDQFPFQQHHQPQQGSYAPQYSTQPSFDHYDLQQQAYPTYNNSPYVTQSQYQHARPSDVFGPNSFNLDPSLSQNATAYPADNSYSFGIHGTETHNTISPQNLQYQISSSQAPVNRSVQNTAYQQRTANDFNQRPQTQANLYFNNAQNGNARSMESPVQYPSLPGNNGPEVKQNINYAALNNSTTAPVLAPRAQPVRSAPPQSTLRVTDPELPAIKNPSTRPPFPYAPFLSWQDVPLQVAPGLKSKY